ncbi:CocE/NonD family hydrolase [Steroidobacter cummioxidans]|uniref:CocE/NonD family hydrolase n=1 Tax=Steroidobacter cummioxidans TaxID=1803913 RepID=UPI000E30F690|nr:CocE/NonD family hydrolase [Steroidobacter cummioxidans]
MRRLLFVVGSALIFSASFAQQTPGPTDDDESRYDIQQDVAIKTPGGATLSAVVVRIRDVSDKLPTLLTLDIYTDPVNAVTRCKSTALRGYVCVHADTRGKRLSPEPIVPYEHDAEDSQAVLDWITRQPWSDGRVGMHGGSFSGFTAWAAAKRKHPALKTIATSAAAIPGLGLPMYRNIFLNANYGWAFYTTNNKYLDERTYNDPQRWSNLSRNWFASGRPYREIDQVDGTPNPWLQRWLQHPTYDEYWQQMVPYGRDFAHIDIPALTITGYYDDGQISALHYLSEHYRYRPKAQHYAVIGPYDHFGTHAPRKEPVLRGYELDPVAQFSTPELVYEWMNYVLRGGPKPTLLKDRINFEVMGGNEWRHAPSLDAMSAKRLRLFFSDIRNGDRLQLAATKPVKSGSVLHIVDLADRRVYHNFNSYPFPIVGAKFQYITELQFISEPFADSTVISGAITGTMSVVVNKKDFDFGVTAYEVMPDGTLFNLGYSLQRASFARDPTRRQLLSPGKTTRLSFTTTVVSRKLAAGSRLLMLFDVNKNPSAQVNYGTGKDVSDESVVDAGEPLRVLVRNDSFIDVPWSD